LRLASESEGAEARVIYVAEPAAPAARALSIASVVKTLIAYIKRRKPKAAATK
jgi:hypothetical protein